MRHVRESGLKSKFIAWAQMVSAKGEQPPGNSIEAISYAYELGFSGVEMDLRLTGDGVPVLMHDDTLDRTTTGSGPVVSLSFAELQQFEIKQRWKGEPVRIASLEQALRVNGDKGTFLCDMRINAKAIDAIRRAIVASGFDEKLLQISAYSDREGILFKEAFPKASVFSKRYGQPETIPFTWLSRIDQRLDGVMIEMPNEAGSIGDIVDFVHSKGKQVVTFVHYHWRDLAALQGLIDDGVDYILTQHHAMIPLVGPAAFSGAAERSTAQADTRLQ